MNEKTYENIERFRMMIQEFYEEVVAAEEDSNQIIPRPVDEPRPLYYIKTKLEQGIKKFDEKLECPDSKPTDIFNRDDFKVNRSIVDSREVLPQIDRMARFLQEVENWLTISSDREIEDDPSVLKSTSNPSSYLYKKHEKIMDYYRDHFAL